MPLDSLPENGSQVIRDLINAREYLISHGWCQWQKYIGEAACLLGAIRATTSQEKVIMDLLQEEVSKKGKLTVTSYNDFPGRTFEEIIELINETISHQLLRTSELLMAAR